MLTATQNRQLRAPDAGALAEENTARAAVYGLLSHLFAAPPADELLQAIAESPDLILGSESPLAVSWAALVAGVDQYGGAAAREQFSRLFVSTAKPPVAVYGSSYTHGPAQGNFLAELRGELARRGFGSRSGGAEFEDHLSAVCDVMRMLIIEANDGDEDDSAFADQQAFFSGYLQPWVSRFVDALAAEAGTDSFYARVAAFASAFFVNETEYFDIA